MLQFESCFRLDSRVHLQSVADVFDCLLATIPPRWVDSYSFLHLLKCCDDRTHRAWNVACGVAIANSLDWLLYLSSKFWRKPRRSSPTMFCQASVLHEKALQKKSITANSSMGMATRRRCPNWQLLTPPFLLLWLSRMQMSWCVDSSFVDCATSYPCRKTYTWRERKLPHYSSFYVADELKTRPKYLTKCLLPNAGAWSRGKGLARADVRSPYSVPAVLYLTAACR